jgi:hypothetical protein
MGAPGRTLTVVRGAPEVVEPSSHVQIPREFRQTFRDRLRYRRARAHQLDRVQADDEPELANASRLLAGSARGSPRA